MKMENSRKILDAIDENKDKFNELKKLGQEIIDLDSWKREKNDKFNELYTILLKNLSPKKVEMLKVVNNIFYASKEGIGTQSRYRKNACNINQQRNIMKDLLIDVLENFDNITGLASEKLERLKGFIEKVELLKEGKRSELIFDKVEITMPSIDKPIEATNMNMGNRGKVHIGNGSWNDHRVYIMNPTPEDYIYMEQTCEQVKELLLMEKKLRQQEKENFEKYFEDIETKFGAYIQSVEMLKELRK